MAERLGVLLEQAEDWLGAVDCYSAALEVEPVAEILYRRLMLCQARPAGRSPGGLPALPCLPNWGSARPGKPSGSMPNCGGLNPACRSPDAAARLAAAYAVATDTAGAARCVPSAGVSSGRRVDP